TTGVDPNTGAAQGDSAGVEFEEGAAAFGGQLHAGVDHHFVPGVVVDYLSGLDELALAQLNVLVARDGQGVVGLDLGPAIGPGAGAAAVSAGRRWGLGGWWSAAKVSGVGGALVRSWESGPTAKGLLVRTVLTPARRASMKICSSPALSSMRSSLKPLPPGLLRLLNRLRVLCAGSSQGTGWALLYRQPLTSGWSGSPSRKLTSTSMPMRGMVTLPQWLPAQLLATGSQQLVWASAWPSRSQWNWTLIRPCSSQWVSSPAGPVTTAVCWPSTRGLGWRRAGRCGVSQGVAWKWLR